MNSEFHTVFNNVAKTQPVDYLHKLYRVVCLPRYSCDQMLWAVFWMVHACILVQCLIMILSLSFNLTSAAFTIFILDAVIMCYVCADLYFFPASILFIPSSTCKTGTMSCAAVLISHITCLARPSASVLSQLEISKTVEKTTVFLTFTKTNWCASFQFKR